MTTASIRGNGALGMSGLITVMVDFRIIIHYGGYETAYRVPDATLRDWEQAPATAPDFAVAYLRLIGH